MSPVDWGESNEGSFKAYVDASNRTWVSSKIELTVTSSTSSVMTASALLFKNNSWFEYKPFGLILKYSSSLPFVIANSLPAVSI